jgi:MFS family permease
MANTPRLTPIQWTICIIAAIGFAFDIYELLMLPLILRPALLELLGAAPGSEAFNLWRGLLFFIPAFVGGVFGLLGGYLTDRLGRRRVLTWSILLYAFSAFAAGFSTSIWMLLFFRCTTFIGVCVEFVAAVAWLAELFDDPEQREKVLGYTQAFSSVGGLMVAVANGLAVAWAADLPAIRLPEFLSSSLGVISEPNAAWRYTLMSGLIPAIPLVIIRPFLPESPKWAQKKAAGTLRRPSIGELFGPELRRTTLVTTLMFACSYGAAFGAIQQIPSIVPALPEVRAKIVAATEGKPEQAAAGIRGGIVQGTAAQVTKVQELGGLYGRILLAALAVVFLGGGRRENLSGLLKTMVIAALAIMMFLSVTESIKLRRVVGVAEGLPSLMSAGETTGSQIMAAVVDVLAYGIVGGIVVAVSVYLLSSLFEAMLPKSARPLLRIFLLPGLIVMPLVFGYIATHSLPLLYFGIFAIGALTVGQFSFWGNYLPRVYPTHLRGTGESFAANIGGRMIGTSFAMVTSGLSLWMPVGEGAPNPAIADALRMAAAAALVGTCVYCANFTLSFWLPEPQHDELPE